jgi:hypothetical protein
MKTNMKFESWAGGRPWIVSSTPCTQALVKHTATAGQRKVSMRVEKESRREKREGDDDKHEVRELGRGQAMDSQQHSLHTSTGTAYSNSKAEESIYTSREGERKREEGGG